jgi:hypothetical integral membrane protein (TIGR02206 family)
MASGLTTKESHQKHSQINPHRTPKFLIFNVYILSCGLMDTLSIADTALRATKNLDLNHLHHTVPLGSRDWMYMNGIFWGLFLLVLIVSKNQTEKTRKSLGWLLGALSLINFAASNIKMYLDHTWYIENSLPLHLCGMSAFIAAYLLIRGSQISYEFLVYWGAGAIHAFLTPEITNGSSMYNHLEYSISHGIIILGSVYATMRLGYTPRPGSWWKVFLYTQLTIPIIGGANYLTGGNYMYLCQKPTADNPFVMGEWPWYILGLEFAIILHFFAFYHLHKALATWRSNRA